MQYCVFGGKVDNVRTSIPGSLLGIFRCRADKHPNESNEFIRPRPGFLCAEGDASLFFDEGLELTYIAWSKRGVQPASIVSRVSLCGGAAIMSGGSSGVLHEGRLPLLES